MAKERSFYELAAKEPGLKLTFEGNFYQQAAKGHDPFANADLFFAEGAQPGDGTNRPLHSFNPQAEAQKRPEPGPQAQPSEQSSRPPAAQVKPLPQFRPYQAPKPEQAQANEQAQPERSDEPFTAQTQHSRAQAEAEARLKAEHEAQLAALDAEINEILAAGGLLSQRQPHYQERRGQLEMAHAVGHALINSELLLSEAGTGTGKTYAYLIPALLDGRSVVISTGSKALQDQLVNSDIPKLLRLLGMEEVSYIGLKGFGNYLCHRRTEQAVKFGELTHEENALVQRFIQREETELMSNPRSCSFGDVNAGLPPALAPKITVSRQQCIGEDCKFFGDQCFPFKARHYAAESRIVVVNHALLFAALASKCYMACDGVRVDENGMDIKELEEQLAQGLIEPHYWFLPRFKALVCDEAHMLPEFGRTFYSLEFDSYAVESWCRQLNRELKGLQLAGRLNFRELTQDLITAILAVRTYLLESNFEGRHNFLKFKYENYDPDMKKQDLIVDKRFRALMIKVWRCLSDIYKKLQEHKESAQEVMGMLIKELKEQTEALILVMRCDEPDADGKEDDNHVCYASVDQHGFVFTYAPIEIGPYFMHDLKMLLTSRTGICMTSATLSVNQSFKKFAFDIGAAGLNPRTLIVPSAFDYEHQACLYVSSAFPAVGDEKRNEQLLTQLYPLMEEVRGGIFLLTTSHKSLQECAQLLNLHFGSRRLVLAQAGGKSNARIMREFKENGQAVLVGTASFWAGVDVPGRALSLVIIDKLPFASPADPFEEARYNKLKQQGGSPFAHICLPEAIIALRQGVGRLIRSETDEGGLIICDPRIVDNKSYSRQILKALPPMHRCQSLKEMRLFFRQRFQDQKS